jgi:hypothetical protein
MSCFQKFFVLFFSFVLLSLVYSVITQVAWSDPSAAIIGAIISGLMTISAGYLAFRETRKTNEITRYTQAQLLLVERIKAVNLVRSHVVDAYNSIYDLYHDSFGDAENITEIASSSNPNYALIHQACIAFRNNFPTEFDFKGTLADSLAILPDEATEQLEQLVGIFLDVNTVFELAVGSINLNLPAMVSQQIQLQKALKEIFLVKEGNAINIEWALSSANEAIRYFIDLRNQYRKNYNDIVGRFIDI